MSREVITVVANYVQQLIIVAEGVTENEAERTTQLEPAIVIHAETGTQSEPIGETHVEKTVGLDTTLGQGMRKKKSYVRLRDYVIIIVSPMSLYTADPNESSEYGIENFLTYDKFSESHRGFLAIVTKGLCQKHFLKQ